MNEIYTKTMKPIHLFREDIEEGDYFVAHIDSVEGHRRVTLEKCTGDVEHLRGLLLERSELFDK